MGRVKIFMINPWAHLPNTSPFLLAEDSERVNLFNERHAGKTTGILLDQLPSPYVGDPKAPIVLLNLNPAYSPTTVATPVLSRFSDVARANFIHKFFDYPFYPLDPSLAGSPSGYEWWSKRCLGDLIQESGLGIKDFSKRIFCAEYFPYHSRKYGWNGGVVPSQRYMLSLVESAISRKASFIALWGNGNKRAWIEAIPSLSSVDIITLRSAQNPKISRGNLADGVFEKIIDKLCS